MENCAAMATIRCNTPGPGLPGQTPQLHDASRTSFGQANADGYVTVKMGAIRLLIIALVAALAVAGVVELLMM
jgi:hypothetical protein